MAGSDGRVDVPTEANGGQFSANTRTMAMPPGVVTTSVNVPYTMQLRQHYPIDTPTPQQPSAARATAIAAARIPTPAELLRPPLDRTCILPDGTEGERPADGGGGYAVQGWAQDAITAATGPWSALETAAAIRATELLARNDTLHVNECVLVDVGTHAMKCGLSGAFNGTRAQLLPVLEALALVPANDLTGGTVAHADVAAAVAMASLPRVLLQLIASYDAVSGPALVWPMVSALPLSAPPPVRTPNQGGISAARATGVDQHWLKYEPDSEKALLVGADAVRVAAQAVSSSTTAAVAAGAAAGASSAALPQYRVSYIAERGAVTDRTAAYKLLNKAVCGMLQSQSTLHQADITRAPVIVCENVFAPKPQREQLTQFLFETWGVPAAYFAHSATLVLYAYGLTSGLVVESGDGQTTCVPVIDGQTMSAASACCVRSVRATGGAVTYALLSRRSGGGVSAAAAPTPLLDTIANREVVRGFKERHAYAAFDIKAEWAAASAAASDAADRTLRLPDGNTVTFSDAERLGCVEQALFAPELGNESLPKLVSRSIAAADVSLRRTLWQHVVLAGGNTQINGLPRRLHAELKKLTPRGGSTQVTVHAASQREHAAWLGARVFSSLRVSEQMYMSKEEYDESGPAYSHRRFAF